MATPLIFFKKVLHLIKSDIFMVVTEFL